MFKPLSSRSLASALRAAGVACAMAIAAVGGIGRVDAQVLIKEGQFEPIKGLEVVEKLGQKVPLDLEFSDADGKKVKLAQYFNQDHKPVVLALVYFRCPMQCPTIMNKMVQRFNGIDWKIGEKYNVVTVSFDPSETVADGDRQRTFLHTTQGSSATFTDGLARCLATTDYHRNLVG